MPRDGHCEGTGAAPDGGANATSAATPAAVYHRLRTTDGMGIGFLVFGRPERSAEVSHRRRCPEDETV